MTEEADRLYRQQELMKKWRHVLDATKLVFTTSGEGELAFWADEATKASRIVEIGTLCGRSAKVMLLANPYAQVWCVDLFQQPGTQQISEFVLRDEIDEGRCKVIKAQSDEGCKIVQEQLNGKLLDLVMVDDGHELLDVVRDVRSFAPLVGEKGIFVGHDYDPDGAVQAAVKQLFVAHLELVPRVWYAEKRFLNP